ncbi:HTH-type transcriptional repressor RspR (plasmid) [Caballeronia sp. SBC1]|uniref:GntR family transcriptional regulator n=1 Tax=unclassified Caballeronia TaxID=2646786 RepID=UPI0013E1FA31|nr:MULTISPECIES: GntR family transcriptional regulator [unclassified Caballeronia]QIE26721.1 HTH-type transcriptional repressor RspR [Caballeronia sp. SBC2]QIN63963.1 HTH-type transcriptional repressor RspR [Caballeronia sp. SBC1]
MHTTEPAQSTNKSADDVYSAIKRAIGETRYAPGEYLREEQLARGLGVSRTPVREAFRRLGAEGWLEVKPNHGVRVKSWSIRDVEEIFEARVLIEPYLTGRAASGIAAPELATLRALADEMLEIAKHPITPELAAQWFAANRTFHDIITGAAGNGRLDQSLRSMKDVPLIKWTFDIYSDDDRARSARQHIEIVDALESRDAVWAEAVMTCHIRAAQKSVVEKFRQEPGQA